MTSLFKKTVILTQSFTLYDCKKRERWLVLEDDDDSNIGSASSH